jgi:hypothetical protein
MRKYILVALVLGAATAVLSGSNIMSLPPLVPQALFALALIMMLLNVMNESDRKAG